MAIAVDSTSEAYDGGVTSLTWAHTCTGSNLILIVGVQMEDTSDTDRVINSVTYNGDALTKVRSDLLNNVRSEIWYRLSPATGSAFNIVATANGSILSIGAQAISLTGVNQSSPEANAGNTGNSTGTDAINATLNTIANDAWVIDTVVMESSVASITVDGAQTEVHQGVGGSMTGGMSRKSVASPTSTTMSWDISGATLRDWASSVASFAPDSGSGTNVSVANIKRILSVVASLISISNTASVIQRTLSVVAPIVSISKSVSVQPVILATRVNSVSIPGEVTVTFQQGVNGYTGTTDNWMEQNALTTNHDGAGLVIPFAFGSFQSRNLIKFDLSSITGPVTVSNATLSIRIKSGLSNDNCVSHVRRVKRAWSETNSSWTNYDTASAWSGLGATDTTDDITASDDGSNSVSGITTPVTITISNLATLVQGWINGDYSNNGMVVYSDAEGDADGLAGDSEDATESNRPKLTITYSTAGATNISTSIVQGTLTVVGVLVQINKSISSLVGTFTVQSPTITTGNSITVNASPITSSLSVVAPSIQSTDSVSSAPVVGNLSVIQSSLNITDQSSVSVVTGSLSVVAPQVVVGLSVFVNCIRFVSVVNSIAIQIVDSQNISPIIGNFLVVSPTVSITVSKNVNCLTIVNNIPSVTTTSITATTYNAQPITGSLSAIAINKDLQKSPNCVSRNLSIPNSISKVSLDLSPIQILATVVPLSSIISGGSKTVTVSPTIGLFSVGQPDITTSTIRRNRLIARSNQTKLVSSGNDLESKFSAKGGLF